MSIEVEGGCLCGAVTIRATLPDAGIDICHCAMCRKWVGGPYFSTRVAERFALEGELLVHRSSEWAERGSCARCGSALFFHYLPEDTHSFAAGLFPDLAGPLREEIFIDEKPGYYDLAGERPRKTGAEIIAEFTGGKSSG